MFSRPNSLPTAHTLRALLVVPGIHHDVSFPYFCSCGQLVFYHWQRNTPWSPTSPCPPPSSCCCRPYSRQDSTHMALASMSFFLPCCTCTSRPPLLCRGPLPRKPHALTCPCLHRYSMRMYTPSPWPTKPSGPSVSTYPALAVLDDRRPFLSIKLLK